MYVGFCFLIDNCSTLHVNLGICLDLSASNEIGTMNLIYIISGIIALGLLVYLILALLKPEWFK